MIEYTYQAKPQSKRQYYLERGLRKTYLNFKQEKLTDDDLETLAKQLGIECDDYFKQCYTYRYYSIEMPLGIDDYDSEVNAIVTAKYPNDVMQSVVNNYLLDPTNDKAKKEFEDMQQWRKEAKEYANDIKTLNGIL